MDRLWIAAFLITAAAVARPDPASAQAYLAVGAGVTTGGTANGARPTYSGAFGYDGELFGVEADFGYTVRLANEEGTHGDNVRTFMGQLLVGPRVGKWKVFGSVGGGLIGAVGHFSHIFTTDDEEAINVFGMSFGGGASTIINDHFGIRFDARYIRALEGNVEHSDARLSFMRAGASLVWRF